MDKSLDDIIKERRITPNIRRGRGRGQNVGTRGRRGRPQPGGIQSKGARQLEARRNFKPITDAREKLIAKTRGVDAREKLIKKAKLTDARVRLNAKRVRAGPQGDNSEDISPPKRGPLQRTIPNPNRQKPQSLQLSVKNDSPQTQFTVRNTSAEKFTVRNTPSDISIRKRITPPRKSLSTGGLQFVVSNPGRENFRSSGALGGGLQLSAKPSPVPLRSTAAMDNPRLTLRDSSKVQRIDSNLSETTGGPLRLSGPIRRPSVDGTRVVISNLHTTVTEDDIKELFGALGILKRVRMVKQGLAEVVYSKRESALKAISTYHNRELDGKAMQCRLDTTSGEGVPVKKNTISDRFKTYSSENNPTLPYQSTIPPSTIVELGEEIINKVLFKLPVTTPSSSKPVIFTVKI